MNSTWPKNGIGIFTCVIQQDTVVIFQPIIYVTVKIKSVVNRKKTGSGNSTVVYDAVLVKHVNGALILKIKLE